MSKELVFIKGERHVVNQCGTCAVWHTIPEIIYNAYKAEGGYWHCPNGHQRGFRKGTDQIEQEEIRLERDRLKQDAARLEEQAKRAEEEASLARVRAEKAEASARRLKKRSSAGTCPCCSRTFSNMAEHMKHRHPEFVADGGAKVVPIKRGAKA